MSKPNSKDFNPEKDMTLIHASAYLSMTFSAVQKMAARGKIKKTSRGYYDRKSVEAYASKYDSKKHLILIEIEDGWKKDLRSPSINQLSKAVSASTSVVTRYIEKMKNEGIIEVHGLLFFPIGLKEKLSKAIGEHYES